MIFEIFLIILGILCYFYYQGSSPRAPNFPPGPFSFPIVGTIPHFLKGTEEVFFNWRKKYGNIVGIQLGSFRAVIISDYAWIKEAFSDKTFSGRPDLPAIKYVALGGKNGIVPSEGPHWEEQRRFALRNLRDFGFGKTSMEGMVHEYVTDIVNSFKAANGAPINTTRKFSLAILGSLWQIVAGEKLSHENPRFQEILDGLQATINSQNVGGFGMLVPWTLKVIPGLVGWNKVTSTIDRVHAFMRGHINEHKKTFDENNIRDLLDLYFLEIKNTKDPKSSFYQETGEKNMLVSVLNLFVAGSETTNMTLNWALIYMCTWPETQEKLREEIDRVVGRDRMVTIEDKASLPYTEALMTEALRMSSIVPFGVFHNTMEDTEFHGYSIPKDTICFANLYRVHNDPEIWGEDVLEFRPERFLTADGKPKKDHPPVIPFSVGKRTCLGETLARIEFFMFLTGLVQNFTFKFDPNTPRPDAKLLQIQGPFRFLPEFQLIFTER